MTERIKLQFNNYIHTNISFGQHSFKNKNNFIMFYIKQHILNIYKLLITHVFLDNTLMLINIAKHE